jgi:hypothetical protein
MFLYIFAVFVLAFLTEAITQIVIKSTIFEPFRRFVSKAGSGVKELFSCGYCFSFWVAFLLTPYSNLSLPLTGFHLVNTVLLVLVVHRLSNVLHNVIDKWTDKYYDTRYVNTDKSTD